MKPPAADREPVSGRSNGRWRRVLCATILLLLAGVLLSEVLMLPELLRAGSVLGAHRLLQPSGGPPLRVLWNVVTSSGEGSPRTPKVATALAAAPVVEFVESSRGEDPQCIRLLHDLELRVDPAYGDGSGRVPWAHLGQWCAFLGFLGRCAGHDYCVLVKSDVDWSPSAQRRLLKEMRSGKLPRQPIVRFAEDGGVSVVRGGAAHKLVDALHGTISGPADLAHTLQHLTASGSFQLGTHELPFAAPEATEDIAVVNRRIDTAGDAPAPGGSTAETGRVFLGSLEATDAPDALLATAEANVISVEPPELAAEAQKHLETEMQTKLQAATTALPPAIALANVEAVSAASSEQALTGAGEQPRVSEAMEEVRQLRDRGAAVLEPARAEITDVLVLALTRRDAFSRRDSIRETWASGHRNVVFVIGEECTVPPEFRIAWTCKPSGTAPAAAQAAHTALLAQEASRVAVEAQAHGDLLVIPAVDSYRHLPAKVKLAYKWATERTGAQWIVKADDDSIVRVKSMSDYLRTFDASEPTILGRIALGWTVHRDGKWAELDYKQPSYPRFPVGSTGHAVSRPVAAYIGAQQAHLFNFQGEDVSLGIWMDTSPLRDRVRWLDSPHMTHTGDCENRSMYFIGHDISEEKMRSCYAKLDEVRGVGSMTRTLEEAQKTPATQSRGQRLEFVHITKTGGSQIEKAAAAAGIAWGACHFANDDAKAMGCPPPDLEGKVQLRVNMHPPWHLPLNYFEKSPYPNARTFVVVRDPYDRAISEYYNKWAGYNGVDPNDPVNLNRWLQHRITTHKGPNLLPQHVYVFNADGTRAVDHTLRVEKLHDEFPRLMQEYGIDVSLPDDRYNARKSASRLTRWDLSLQTRALIEQRYAKDFDLLGYKRMPR